jgi:hypothetical protein
VAEPVVKPSQFGFVPEIVAVNAELGWVMVVLLLTVHP